MGITLLSEMAKRNGIRIIGVGITRSVDEAELKAISSSPQEIDRNYFMVPYFDQLTNIVEKLATEVCSEDVSYINTRKPLTC